MFEGFVTSFRVDSPPNDDVRVILLRGTGRAFSVGFDVDRDAHDKPGPGARHGPRGLDGPARDRRPLARGVALPEARRRRGARLLPRGATQLSVFCDLTVVAEDAVSACRACRSAAAASPAVGTLIGPKRAKEMSFIAGSRLSGAEASDSGWANYAVTADAVQDKARRLASDIARKTPPVLRMKKMAVNRVMDVQGFRTIAPMGAETDALRTGLVLGWGMTPRTPRRPGHRDLARDQARAGRRAGAAGDRRHRGAGHRRAGRRPGRRPSCPGRHPASAS